MKQAPQGARDHLAGLVRAERERRWADLLRCPDDPKLRRSYDSCVELCGFLASLRRDDEDAMVLDTVAASVFSGPEVHGLISLHGRRLDCEPRIFLSALATLAATKWLDATLATIQ